MKQFVCLAILLTFIGVSTSAQAEMLKGRKLRKAVSGKTVYLSMRMGIVLPIKYRSGGVMYGKLSGIGALFPSNIPKKDQGRWWVRKDRLCQIWNKWLKRRSYCYQLSRVNGKVYWRRNDGARGTARIVAN